jgi:hypothetical protein
LQSLCSHHNYVANHACNLDETSIQGSKQAKPSVLARKISNAIYNTIPKYLKWLIINYVIKVLGGVIPRFQIFRIERI